MLGNWSVILNILLLAGVFIAIVRTIQTRRQENRQLNDFQPLVGGQSHSLPCDDIIAVRKIDRDSEEDAPILSSFKKSLVDIVDTDEPPRLMKEESASEAAPTAVMMFLLAKENRQLAGYELLQTLLSAGLRFGEGHLFHRHQYSNGQGPVLCSVAAATSTGMFDLQNIGAFSVHGLCIFMEASGSTAIERERFTIMLETAKQLSEDLNAHLLDEHRQPLTPVSLARYYRVLNISDATSEEVA